MEITEALMLERELAEKDKCLLDQICEEISELLCGYSDESSIEKGEDGHVSLHDTVQINAVNWEAAGYFWFYGKEYGFLCECGNNNGFVFRRLTEGAVDGVEYVPIVYALAPSEENIRKCSDVRYAKSVLSHWDAVLGMDKISSIPSQYAYDMMFDPSNKTEKYWKEKAESYGFRITTEDQSKEIRSQLSKIAEEKNE